MITLWGRNNSTSVKKVLLTFRKLELPCEQIPAGREFGINHDTDFLAMNPSGLASSLRDNESGPILWESNAIIRYLAARCGQKRLWVGSPTRCAEAEGWADWASQTLNNIYRGILMGLVKTPSKEHDQAAIDASCEECDVLSAPLDARLAKVKWFSSDEFDVGDIVIAPFIYSLLNIGPTWTLCLNLQRWHRQPTERLAMRKAIMIPVS